MNFETCVLTHSAKSSKNLAKKKEEEKPTPSLRVLVVFFFFVPHSKC